MFSINKIFIATLSSRGFVMAHRTYRYINIAQNSLSGRNQEDLDEHAQSIGKTSRCHPTDHLRGTVQRIELEVIHPAWFHIIWPEAIHRCKNSICTTEEAPSNPPLQASLALYSVQVYPCRLAIGGEIARPSPYRRIAVAFEIACQGRMIKKALV